MKLLGVRVGGSKTRVAAVEGENGSARLIGSAAGSRLVYPVSISSIDGKVHWLYREMGRIYEENPDIGMVCIKTNEYGLSDTKTKRESAFLEAAVILFCSQKSIPVTLTTYASLKTNGTKSVEDAERRIGRTCKYWDKQVADAVNAAWHGLRNQ